jgi:AraC-like DNA-binding protein
MPLQGHNEVPGQDHGSQMLDQLRPYVRQCGCTPRKAWHIRQRKLLDFLLVYIESGNGRFIVGGVEYDARDGDLFWIPPDTPHEMQGFSPLMKLAYVHFDLIYRPEFSHWDFNIPEGMLELGELNALMHPPAPPPFDRIVGRLQLPRARQIGELIRSICEHATRATAYAQLRMSAEIMHILTTIIEDTTTPTMTDSAVRYGSVMEQTAEFMRDHCADPLSVESLATRAGVSTCYFRRLFAQNFGMTPHAYLTELRLSRAKDLMLHTAMTLSEIALQSGFSSIHNFSRAFKKLQGISPSDFRRTGRHVPVKVEGRTASYAH